MQTWSYTSESFLCLIGLSCYSAALSTAQLKSSLAVFCLASSANSLSSIILNLKQLLNQFGGHSRAETPTCNIDLSAGYNLGPDCLPGIALAQRTTVTSCRSPSSLRLVSKDAGLSGWAWSCPALTTAGSMVCKTLSRERQERRVGGMPRARAWDAAKDTVRTMHRPEEYCKKTTSFMFNTDLAWRLCDNYPHNEPWQLHFRAPTWHLSTRPSLLALCAPRKLEVAPPRHSSSVRPPSACDLK